MEKRQLQAAADAAALAGALEIGNCGSTADCTNMQNAAKQALIENGYASGNITVVTQCGSSSNTNTILTINNGPCQLGSKSNDPNYGNTKYVETELSQPVNMTFARAVGISSFTITVRSEAGLGNSPNCLFTSMTPSDQSSSGPDPGILLNGGSTIDASCGIVDDSGSGGALVSNSPTTVTATSFSVHGGWSPNNGGTFSSTPKTSQTAISDPLSYLTPPGEGTIQQSGNYTPANGATLQPGAYLGGVNLNNGVSVTLAAGTYYFGGSFIVGQNDTLTGTAGVLMYFASGSLVMNTNSTANLVAQTSGTYAGILIYENSSDSSSMILDGGATAKFQGVIYAPDANLTFNSTGNAAAYTIVDVGSLTVNSGSDLILGTDFSSLSGGSPIKSGSAILVE